MCERDKRREDIIDYYSSICESQQDECVVNSWDLSPAINDVIAQMKPDTMNRYYGTVLVVPEHLEGKRVLDIGCGSGSLVFILSKLVGPTGSVVGIDITPSLLEKCKAHEDDYRLKWGYEKKNTEFHLADAEDLSQFPDQSFDVIVSNGLMSLLTNKDKGYSEVFRLLKEGGEFYMSDIYGSSKATENMIDDTRLWNFGLTGSQLIEEFHASVHKAGFTTPYLTSVASIKMSDKYLEMLPNRRYLAAGNRMFRLGELCKRGPALITYNGKIQGEESEFKWDVNLTFKTGRPVTVDGHLATILANTRYKDAFDILDTTDDPTTHKGQDPFSYFDELNRQGILHPDVFTV